MKGHIFWLAVGIASGSFFGLVVSKGETTAAVIFGGIGAGIGEIGYLIVKFLHRQFGIDRSKVGSHLLIGTAIGGLLGAGLGPFSGLGTWVLSVRNPAMLGGPSEIPLGVICGVLLGAAVGGCVATFIWAVCKPKQVSLDQTERSLPEV